MNLLLSPEAPASFLYFLDLAFKATILLFVAGTLRMIFRRFSAASRHAMWVLVAAALLFLPVLGNFLPGWRLAVLPAESALPAARLENPVAADGRLERASEIAAAHRLSHPESADAEPLPLNSKPETRNAKPHSPPVPAPQPAEVAEAIPEATPAVSLERRSASASSAVVRWQRAVIVLWLIGCGVLLVRILAAHLRVARLVRRAPGPPAADPLQRQLAAAADLLGVRRRIHLRVSAQNGIPFACGLWKPAVVLPEAAQRWPEEKLRAVLLHELAHVKRRDCLTQFLAQVSLALYWFHPLAWLLNRQMRIEREKACDDLVLNAGVRPALYGETLLRVASQQEPRAGTSSAALAMARKSSLEGRLLAILDTKKNRRGLTRAALAAALLLCALVAIPVASVRLAAKEQPSSDAVAATREHTSEEEVEKTAVIEISAQLEAHKPAGGVDRLSAPRLTVLSGRMASLVSAAPDIGGIGPASFEIEVTPRLVDGAVDAAGRIRLRQRGGGGEEADESNALARFDRPFDVELQPGDRTEVMDLGLGGPDNEEGRVLLFLTATLVEGARPSGPEMDQPVPGEEAAALERETPSEPQPDAPDAARIAAMEEALADLERQILRAIHLVRDGRHGSAAGLVSGLRQLALSMVKEIESAEWENKSRVRAMLPRLNGFYYPLDEANDALSANEPEWALDILEGLLTEEDLAGLSTREDSQESAEFVMSFRRMQIDQLATAFRFLQEGRRETARRYLRGMDNAVDGLGGILEIRNDAKLQKAIVLHLLPLYQLVKQALEALEDGDEETAADLIEAYLKSSDGSGSAAGAADGKDQQGAAAPPDAFSPESREVLRMKAEVKYGAGRWTQSVALADLDDNGCLDVITANRHDHSVMVRLGRGDGSFGPAMLYGTEKDPVFVQPADLNGDGIPDLVTANRSDSVSVLLGRGDGTFADPVSYSAGRQWDARQSRLRTEVNDANPDAYVPELGATVPHFGGARTALTPVSVAVADFNGDGIPDLATANFDANSISLLLGKGGGVFGDPVVIGAGDGPVSIVSGDFDGNGHADLAVAHRREATAAVLLGNGQGEFSGTNYSIGSRAGFIEAGILTGDGALDLVVANYGSSSLTLLAGDGAGGFSGSELALGSVSPSSLALGDMNGDGRLDIVTTSHGRGPTLVAVLLAGDEADFSPPPRLFQLGTPPDAVAVGDLNGDGFPDIVTANVTNSSISVLVSEEG